MKIGVFDSGIGGMTVLAELRKSLGPGVQYVYLGDTAHLPYGTKSPTQIQALSTHCALTLKAKQVDLVVVACNTASSWALSSIQNVMGDTPVIGVVGPGVQAVISAVSDLREKSGRDPGAILILATKATVQSRAYRHGLSQEPSVLDASGTIVPNKAIASIPVYEQACPLLVPMIEEGWVDHPILHQTVSEYVTPYLKLHSHGVALLGCTHYPWIHSAFEKALPGWSVVNSAQSVVHFLKNSKLIDLPGGSRSGFTTDVEWIFTDPASVPPFAKIWI